MQVFWGYALFPDRVGNFVPKPMAECNGAEILAGALRSPAIRSGDRCDGQLHSLQNALHHQHVHAAHCAAIDRCRCLADSKNLAFISQFVEIPDDVVFTVEYSVRAAQMAVYELLGIDTQGPAHNAARQIATHAV